MLTPLDTSSSADTSASVIHLQHALELAPQAILITALDGTILWTNGAARDTAGAHIGRRLQDVTLNRPGALDTVLELAKGTSRPLNTSLQFPGAFALWNVWRVDGPSEEEPPFLVFQADTKRDLLARFLSMKRKAEDAALDRDRAAESARRLQDEATHLHRMTQMDRLTGLPNAEGFEMFTKRVLSRPSCSGVFIFADLDQFKRINDTFGHDAGDAVLREIARRYTGATRSRDCVARLGGDEFAFWFDGLTQADVGSTVERLEQLTVEPIPWDDPFDGDRHELRVGVSFGEAYAPNDGASFSILKAVSDRRMYATKRTKNAGGR